jgi:GT2 family glycosyltransferase
VIRQANGGPAAARNAGVRAAEGRIVLFLDDDLVPGSDLVSEHLRLHDAERRIAVIGPLCSLPHYEQPWVAWQQAKVEAQYAAMARGDWEPSFRQFWTANASVARELVLEAGGFDTALLRNEDLELGARLVKRGVQFRFNPAAAGLHHAERSLESWANSHRAYGRLDFSIFRHFGGEEAALDALAENWRCLHPATRWFVRGCLGRQRAAAAAAAVLQGCIRAAGVVRGSSVSDVACSALANLLYWEAAAAEIGRERIAEVLRRGEEKL